MFYYDLNRSVLFAYALAREQSAPQKILEGYQGYMQSDDDDIYEDFRNKKGITQVGCLANPRKKFYEALPADRTIAEEVLSMFRNVYAVERHIKEHQLVGEAKPHYRKENVLAVMEELKP